MATTDDIPELPAFGSIKPAPRDTPAIAALQQTLGTLYRVTVAPTARMLLGTFVCIDPQGNLVLDQTLEFELDERGDVSGDPSGRDVGLVMIKRQYWTRVERLLTDEERQAAYEQQLASQGQQQGCAPS